MYEFNLPIPLNSVYLLNYIKYISKILNKRVNEWFPNSEKHHILPISLGGNNDNSNLVYLTKYEHYIAHYLLMRAYENMYDKKMCYAFYLMSYGYKKLNEKKYNEVCEIISKGKTIGGWNKGRKNCYKRSDETKRKISSSQIGKSKQFKPRKCICLVCGKEYLGYSTSKYCSLDCKIKYNYKQKYCVFCNAEITGRSNKYCSIECENKAWEVKKKLRRFTKKDNEKCLMCGKELNQDNPYLICSNECFKLLYNKLNKNEIKQVTKGEKYIKFSFINYSTLD